MTDQHDHAPTPGPSPAAPPPQARPARPAAPKTPPPAKRRGRPITPLPITNMLVPILAKMPEGEREARAAELRAVLVNDDLVEAVLAFREAGHVDGAHWDAAMVLTRAELAARP